MWAAFSLLAAADKAGEKIDGLRVANGNLVCEACVLLVRVFAM